MKNMKKKKRNERSRAALLGGVILLLALALVPAAAARQENGDAEPEEAPVKQIKMYAENWKWTPNVIRVPQGTKVVIDFVSRDASHSFVLKAYRIKVKLPERSETRFEFVADKAGEFRWRCGRPCGNGCAKMTGKFIVE